MLEKQAHICSLLVSRASPREGEEEEESLRRAGWVLGSFCLGNSRFLLVLLFLFVFFRAMANSGGNWWPTNINIRRHHFLNVKQNAADRFC